MKGFYAEARTGDALAFHRLAAQIPCAAAKAVHSTFRMTLEILFNCCAPANCKSKACFADGYPCKCEPGALGYLLGYLGVIEPQMRLTEHMHALMQVLGFRHPRDFFRGDRFVNMFRRIWAYVASITFRSLEGFARYLGTGVASGTLRELPLMRLEKS